MLPTDNAHLCTPTMPSYYTMPVPPDPAQQPTQRGVLLLLGGVRVRPQIHRPAYYPVGLLLLLGGVRSSSARHLRPAHPEGLLVLGGVRSSAAARHLRAAYPASQRGVLLLGGVSMHHAAAEAVTSSDAASAARATAAQRHKPMSRTARGEGRSCSPRRQCLLHFGI